MTHELHPLDGSQTEKYFILRDYSVNDKIGNCLMSLQRLNENLSIHVSKFCIRTARPSQKSLHATERYHDTNGDDLFICRGKLV
jgi:hypothetical protein